ncbi:MAG: hypothetical protein IPO15_25905 [Anaerolineae bacterium]|nr:hypothetical protein [Anaerolineae bacterium]
MWANVSDFVRKAGSPILVASLVIWLLLNLPWGVQDQRHSLSARSARRWRRCPGRLRSLGRRRAGLQSGGQRGGGQHLARSAAPQALRWRCPTPTWAQEAAGHRHRFGQGDPAGLPHLLSLLPGLGGIAPCAGHRHGPGAALRQHFTPLSGLSYLVFVLLYVPCAATLGAIKAEFGWRWAAFSAGYQTGMAYLAAVLVFQVGRLAGVRLMLHEILDALGQSTGAVPGGTWRSAWTSTRRRSQACCKRWCSGDTWGSRDAASPCSVRVARRLRHHDDGPAPLRPAPRGPVTDVCLTTRRMVVDSGSEEPHRLVLPRQKP